MPVIKDDVKGGLNKTTKPRPAGMIEPGSIDLHSRPVVHNKDGSISTVRSISVTGNDGRAYLIPTVVGHKVVSDAQAIKHWQKTGQHLGVFTTWQAADQYAQTLHEQQAKEYLPEKPVPVLQSHGFQGGINEFNTRVQSVHDSYTQAYGVEPSPGLVFDLAKSPVDTAHFAKLFTVPLSAQQARSRAAIASQGLTVSPTPTVSVKQLSSDLLHAAQEGNFHEFLETHADIIHGLSQNKNNASVIAGAVFNAKRLAAFKDVDTRLNNGEIGPDQAKQELQAQGFLPGGVTLHGVAHPFNNIVGKGLVQIADSLVHSPAGVVALGKAAGLDTRDVVLHPMSPGFKRTQAIGKATALGVKADVQHPGENPGYLFLDILGVASAGAGGAARLGEAGRVIRAGEGVRAAGKALGKKAPLQRATLDYGGFTEEMPLSQNPLVAEAQKFIISRRQKGANLRLENGDVPSGLLSLIRPESARDFLDEHLGFAAKMGREADSRKRIDHIEKTQISRELDAVAGRAVMQARVFAKVPSKLRGSLTRGEQKAIQVQSWDIAGDDLAKVQAERDFHNRMIEMGVGDPKAHRRQLADLKLAENVLKNPSPRFQKALALTKDVIAEQERIKIQDLGLLPETAEGRVARAGAALQAETPFGGYRTERVNPDSFYLPTQPRGKGKRPPSDRPGYYPSKAGPFGVPLGRDLPELTHEFTGKALMAGDIRIDATSLATEAYGRTVRAATVRNEHAKLWAAAHDTPRTRFDVPIRDSNDIPDKLREIVARLDEGDFGPADAEQLPPDARALIQELYPSDDKIRAEKIEGVKWIDGRLLGEGSKLPHVPGGAAKISQAVQSPLRFTTLYLRPAYILNKLGNHAMLWLDQGIHTVPNFIKAMSMDSRYGAANTRTIHALVGASRSESYVASSSGRISHAVADFWNRVADKDERATSFIYYMERKGYKSREQVDALLHDKAHRADLNEITRRANKALVQFDNLLPVEKNYIRHFVFVYPWVSRSAVWSIRTLLEHPAKVDLLAQLGRQDMEDDPIFKAAPAWFKRTGYIPVGWNSDGTPRVINPTSVNSFSTIGDFLAIGRGVTMGDKYASAEDFLGPAPKFMLHAISGRDEFGNQYPGSQWAGAAKQVLIGLPQVSAYEKGQKAQKAAKKGDVGSRSSLVAAFHSNLKATVMSPGWLDGFGSLLAGGLSPRDVNLDALAARYWNDQDPEVRHVHELDLLNRALGMQGEVLGREVPKAVRSAVADQANIDFTYKKFLKESGRVPTDKERAGFTIDYLHKQGLMSDDKAAEAKKALAPLADKSDIGRLRSSLLDKYANGKALRDWDTDVRTVASFTPEVLNQKAASLYAQGLIPQKRFQASQDKLYEYGRKYVEFTHKVKEMKASGASPAALRAFQDENDKPVDGLPSFVRMAWANQTPEDQQQSIHSAVTQNWGSLTAFDKALLGRPSDAKVTAGWAKLKEIIATQQTDLKRAGRSFPSGHARTLAKYVEKYYDAPGLVKDFDFSKQPMAVRLKYLAPIQKSPNRGEWDTLLSYASAYHKYLTAKDDRGRSVYNHTQVRQGWIDYVNSPAVQKALTPAFKSELAGYGKKFLGSLVG